MSDEEATRAATILIGHTAMNSLARAHIVLTWEADAPRQCKTCDFYDTTTWFPNGRDKPAVPYCVAESCTCAPNGFDEWVSTKGVNSES